MKEGRFLGIEVDAMGTPRQEEPFFAEAERIEAMIRHLDTEGFQPASCKELFQLGIQ